MARCRMPKPKPNCGACQKRYPGCHNPETCKDWRDYIAAKAEWDARVKATRGVEVMMYGYKAGILREYTRDKKRKGRCQDCSTKLS